jgi:hypothetical protein
VLNFLFSKHEDWGESDFYASLSEEKFRDQILHHSEENIINDDTEIK